MNRLFVLAVIVVALAACQEGTFHLVRREPVPPIAPHVSPPTPAVESLIPTVTPTPEVSR